LKQVTLHHITSQQEEEEEGEEKRVERRELTWLLKIQFDAILCNDFQVAHIKRQVSFFSLSLSFAMSLNEK